MPTISSAATPVESLEDRIYEASVLPEFWRPVLRDLATAATGGEGIIFARRDAEIRLVTSSDQYARDAQEFFSLYPENERTRRLVAARHPGFMSDDDVFGAGERETLPIFRDFFIPRGYGSGVATVIPLTASESVIVHCEGRYDGTPYPRKKLAWLDSLRPHLARAALVSSRLAFERAKTAVETLAALGMPACAIQIGGEVVFANEAFSAESQYWTTRGANRIALTDGRVDAMLYRALQSMRDGYGVSSLPIAQSQDRPAAVLHVVPIRRAAHDLFARASAILVLATGSVAAMPAPSLLQALFDLSPTEAVLAAHIAAGQTLEQVALARGKSVHTVRNQLKSVLAKTGCARQVDLARLLAQLVPPINQS